MPERANILTFQENSDSFKILKNPRDCTLFALGIYTGRIDRAILLCVTMFALFFSFCCMASFATDSDESNLSLPDRVFIASKIYGSIKTSFVHGDNNLDLDKLYKKYVESIVVTANRLDFDRSTMEFLSNLHNGHTFFNDKFLYEHAGNEVGFRCLWINDKLVVSESARDDVHVGDVLDLVDGVSCIDFFHRYQKYICASSERGARSNFLSYYFLLPYKFEVRLTNGKTIHVDRNQRFSFSGEKAEGRWLKESELAYIRIPSFGGAHDLQPSFESQAVAFVKQYWSAKAIIIDLRNNHGGNTPAALIKVLMDLPYKYFIESYGVRNTLSEFSEDLVLQNIVKPSDPERGYFEVMGGHYLLSAQAHTELPVADSYHGKVIILANGICGSACEDFIEPFKESHRAVIIGETSAGCSGQPFYYEFGNGMTIGIGAKRLSFPDGSQFEGIGIAPDIEIKPTLDDLAQGRDRVMEKAVELAK